MQVKESDKSTGLKVQFENLSIISFSVQLAVNLSRYNTVSSEELVTVLASIKPEGATKEENIKVFLSNSISVASPSSSVIAGCDGLAFAFVFFSYVRVENSSSTLKI